MCTWNTAVTFQHGGPLKKLASLGVQDTKCVGNWYPTRAPASARQQCDVESTGCQMAGTMWWCQSKRTTKFLDDSSQHCTHQGTHSHRQMCTCMTYGTLLWIILQHCAVCHGGCVCTLTKKRNMAKIMACLFHTTLCSWGKQISATVHHWQWGMNPTSHSQQQGINHRVDTPLAHPGKRCSKWHHLLTKCWPLYYRICCVQCWWTSWNMFMRTGTAPSRKASKRPRGENILVSLGTVWFSSIPTPDCTQ